MTKKASRRWTSKPAGKSGATAKTAQLPSPLYAEIEGVRQIVEWNTRIYLKSSWKPGAHFEISPAPPRHEPEHAHPVDS